MKYLKELKFITYYFLKTNQNHNELNYKMPYNLNLAWLVQWLSHNIKVLESFVCLTII